MTTSAPATIDLGLLRQPAAVHFGAGQRSQLPYVVAKLGSSVLLCTDERMATTDEFAEMVRSLEDAGLRCQVFSRVEPDLPRSNLMELRSALREPLEVVVGIGGGSVLDFAKVAAIILAHDVDVRDLYGENRVPGPGLPVVTVPTTGGTGAEVTCISVVYDAEKGMKVGVASAYLEARVAIVDPELTLSCPPGLTAATGADAMSHLVETFTGRRKHPTAADIDAHLYVGKNVLTDLYARHGLHLLNRSLERVVMDPTDIEARSDTMLAAMCAGMAINTAGTAGAHAIQSPIGALTRTSHGFGVGALLPYVMRFNLPSRVTEFAEIGRVLGVRQGDDEAMARAAIERIEDVLDALGVPLDLKTLGLVPEHFEQVAQQSMLATRLTANNPRELTTESIISILEHGYRNDRSWWTE